MVTTMSEKVGYLPREINENKLKKIVSIGLGPSSRNHRFLTRIFSEDIEIEYLATAGNPDYARELVGQFDGKVDVIGLDMNITIKVGKKTYTHPETKRIASAAVKTPVVDGVALKST